MFYNTHTHLNAEELYDDRKEIIQDCLDHNVTRMTVVGYDVPSSKLAVSIAHEYDFIYATVGISPNDVDGFKEEDLQVIEDLSHDEKVCAIGEIGLDYHYDCPKDVQRHVFEEQLKLAEREHKPIVTSDIQECQDAKAGG